MKILTKIIKFLLIMILTIIISLLIFIYIMDSTILNKEYILDQIEKSKYYDNLEKEIESSFENYIAQSGLEENVIENIVTEVKIKNDTQRIIENIYDGTEKIIDTKEIEENLRDNIEKSLGNKKLNITQKNAINQYVEKICNEYKETMSHTKYEKNINEVIKKVNKYINIIKRIVIIFIIVLIVIILLINYKNILRGLSQIGISLLSTGIIYLIVKLYINSKIKVQNLVILNNAVSETVKTIITDILNVILKDGLIVLVCGILIIILLNTLNKIIDNKK